jgi:hypothetical protein
MPLLRSRMDAHRQRFKFMGGFFAVMTVITLAFIAILAGHYVLGWW